MINSPRIEEVQDFIDRFSYAPGWVFHVMDSLEGPELWIDFSVPDAYQEAVQVQRIKTLVPPFETVTQFYQWLLWRLGRIALHEVMEFFKVDGKRLFDPHELDPR